MIDDIDREIVALLRADGRMPYSQLGQAIGLSDAAARQRVNRLVEHGVIDIVAVADPRKVGLDHQAMLAITVDRDVREVARRVGEHVEVAYVVMTSGRFDLLAEVVTNDPAAHLDVVAAIRAEPGVSDIEQLGYLGITKQTYDWGIG